jgi:hypothetical protein
MIGAGLPLVIVQPGLIYGPGDTSSVRTAVLQYLKRKLPMMPAVTAFCWAHVEDVARGHIMAMEQGVPGESYIIAGERRTFVEAMELAERITGVPAPRMVVAPGLMKASARLMGMVEKVLPVPVDVHRRVPAHQRWGDVPRRQQQGAAQAGLRSPPAGRRPARDAAPRDGAFGDDAQAEGIGGVLKVTQFRAAGATSPGLPRAATYRPRAAVEDFVRRGTMAA